MDLIPTLAEFSALTKIKKYKNNSLSVDDDFEKFEKKLKENPKLAKRFYARFIDITGQQFDNLTAIKYMG
ncbi:MAG: hypothetical protein J5515_06840, partial [Lachnospiraceae bacterium]|nr:hypothetical protein [Lachnospiraceae bacterium]